MAACTRIVQGTRHAANAANVSSLYAATITKRKNRVVSSIKSRRNVVIRVRGHWRNHSDVKRNVKSQK